jgi:hypothetical protein
VQFDDLRRFISLFHLFNYPFIINRLNIQRVLANFNRVLIACLASGIVTRMGGDASFSGSGRFPRLEPAPKADAPVSTLMSYPLSAVIPFRWQGPFEINEEVDGNEDRQGGFRPFERGKRMILFFGEVHNNPFDGMRNRAKCGRIGMRRIIDIDAVIV